MINIKDIHEGIEIETVGGMKDILGIDYDLIAGHIGKVYMDGACQWAVRLNKAEWKLEWFRAGNNYFGLKLTN